MRTKEASIFHHLLLLLLISYSYFHYYYCEACHEEERRALLHIKDSLKPIKDNLLHNWVGKDCCKWDGIECDNSSSHIMHLDLNYVRNWTSELRSLYLNMTMLSSFKMLRYLDLSSNLMKSNGTELLQVVCQFNLIEHLDVSYNSLEGVVPPCLGNLTSLTHLSLSQNEFQGNIPSLSRLNALEELHMSYNRFHGNMNILHLFGENHPIRMRDASNFSNATISPPWKKLQRLDVSGNELTGDGWDLAQVVCQLSFLEVLDVSNNYLGGVVPGCLGNLTSLTRLDLSSNKFQGNIPSLSHLNALEELFMTNNQFHGNILHLFGENHPIRMRDATNFSNTTISPSWKKLQRLDVRKNELTGDGWDIAQVICNAISLNSLYLSGNKFQGNIPSLSCPNALEYLRLSDNQFHGNILHLFGENRPIRMRDTPNFSNATISPPWKKLQSLDVGNNELTGDGWDLAQVVCQLSDIYYLSIGNNSLEGVVPPCLGNLTSLLYLDLSENKFQGDLAQAICQLKSLERLTLSHNSLEGRLHPCLGMMHSIVHLDLSYNRFQGDFPPISDSLVYLDLSYNRLEGDILERDSNMTKLRVLKLQNNRFTRLTMLPRLLILVDLRHNYLSGYIYSALLSLFHLRVLLLGENQLEGKIPKQLCEMEMLHFIDLSDNNLSGKIPSCLNNISSMRDKYRLSNEGPFVIEIPQIITGGAFKYISSFKNLIDSVDFTTKGNSYTFEGDPLTFFTGIDLSCNQLTGGIPFEIGDLRNLHALNLSNNRLTGSLPASFQNMENIESLDLSCNELSGALPIQLTQLHLLAVFNVSFNNLSGSIPFNQQFSTFKNESFMGNVGLCGPQVDIKCSTNTALGHNPLQLNFDDEDGATSLIENRLFFYSWVAISYALGLWVVIGLLIFSKKQRQKYFRTIDEYIYTSQEKFWIILNYFKVCN